MGAISNLVAGIENSESHSGEFSTSIAAIELSIADHEKELAKHWEQPENADIRVFASCARLLLEQSTAILLGRVDPIRLITISKGSSSSDFKIGYRNASSFNWSKDVVPEAKPGPSGFWTQENIGKGVQRALLDGHLSDYLFSSAHSDLIDAITESTKNENELPDWIIELLKIDHGKAVLAKLRTYASEAYSTLSKGVHFEFFLGKATKPDSKEICSATSKAIIVITTTAMYTHFTDISINRIPKIVALDAYLNTIKQYQHHG